MTAFLLGDRSIAGDEEGDGGVSENRNLFCGAKGVVDVDIGEEAIVER